MSIDTLRAQISDVISNETCEAEFFFLLEDAEEISIKRADMDENLQDELTSCFIESLGATILFDEELALLDISNADDRARAIYRYDLPEIPERLSYLKTVLLEEDFDVFDFGSDSLKHLKGILIIIGHDDQQLAIYKHQYPISLVERDSSILNLVLYRNQNRLVKLDDDILRINPKFEFMCVGDEYYIVDIKTLERFFGFHDAVRRVAAQGIANINATCLVIDTQPLVERLDDVSFSRKLVRATRSSPVLGVIPNAQIINFIHAHPVLNGKFRFSDDGSMIKLDTKVSQNLFLKLLSDDFLLSELTKLYYASLAKDALI